ncbi:MAG: iron ABC transporter permease [Pseudomonadota bacterium]
MNTLSESIANRHRQRLWTLIILAIGLLISLIMGLAIGPLQIPATTVISILADLINPFVERQHDHVQETVVQSLRGPRVLLGMIVGAALAVAGACFQALFRNPLADPGVIGVSAGAATAAVTYIVVGQQFIITLFGYAPVYGLPISAMLGALLSVYLLYLFANRASGIDVATLLLAGIAVNAFCAAITGVLVFISDDQQLRELTFWTLGSLARAQWEAVLPAFLWIMITLLILITRGKALNALALGEADAFHLGFNVQRLKQILILFGAASVGAAVALTGVIGFIGLVIPHIVRLLIGADNRYVLPGSAIAGAGLILLADLLARIIVQPTEMPIGIITSILGAPFFLYLLRKRNLIGLPS